MLELIIVRMQQIAQLGRGTKPQYVAVTMPHWRVKIKMHWAPSPQVPRQSQIIPDSDEFQIVQ